MRPTLVLVLLLSVPLALALPCTQADNECLNNNLFCFKKQRFRCPAGTRCSTPPEGSTRSPCVSKIVNPTCPFGDFVCASDITYCHGGKLFRCADGTKCRGGAGRGLAPCRGIQRAGTCALGEYSCISRSSFCMGGKPFGCPAGTVCRGQAPCVDP